MNNNGAHSSLPTPNTSASSSTNNTPVVPNATVPASSSTSTVQGPAPQHGNLTFGTPAEQEMASRPRRDLALQRERLRVVRALQQTAAQRAQFQLQAAQAQPPLPQQHGPRYALNFDHHPPPQTQPLHRQQAHPLNVPALPNLNFPGPPHNALNGIANENVGFGVVYGPQGMPAPMWNAAVPPLVLYVPAPPPLAMQGHMPQLPEAANHGAPFLEQQVRQVPPAPFVGPPYHPQQLQQAQIPQVPPLGPLEGGSTRSLKRKAVDADDTTRQKQKRHRPQDDRDFEPAQPGPDGKAKWKCLKKACAKVKPMLENSVHNHVTQTISHQVDSPENLSEYVCSACGATFKRPDAMTIHIPSNQYVKNESKSPQASSPVLGNSASVAGPSSSGPAPSSVTQQSLPLPVATPDIVQAVSNSTSVAAAPVEMPQRQFTFQARGPAPSSVAPRSSAQAMSVTQPGPSLPVLPQEVSSEVQSDTQASLEATSVQRQPAVALSSHAIQGDSSTPDQTSITLPPAPEPRSVQLPSGIPSPIIAGDLSFLIFKPTAATPSAAIVSFPSEEAVDDSSAGPFSSPPSPTPSEDVLDSLHLSVAPQSGAQAMSVTQPVPSLHELLQQVPSPPSPTPSEDVLDSLHLFSAPPSPT